MLELGVIADYVKHTAIIIASVIEMDVLITDKNNFIVADSLKIGNSENTFLSEDSILKKVLLKKEPIVLTSKSLHKGCLNCESFNICDVEAIVGVPILFENHILGTIGVYAPSIAKKEVLVEKSTSYIDFIFKMCDLMISKLLEKEKSEKLNIMRKRLMSIMDSMENSVVALDENGEIIYNNKEFEALVGVEITSGSSIFDFIDEKYIYDSIFKNKALKNKEVYITAKEEKVFSLLSTKPIEFKDRNIGTLCIIKNMLDVYKEVNELSNNQLSTTFEDVIGENLALLNLKDTAKKIANSKSSILISGESGTGKELFARAIHNHSDVRDKPFIAINCAAIPENLLESEFFGYEEGAFSGAKKGGKLGKLQLAHGGTVFLDEIGEMSLYLQPKILRVLQEKSIEKLGGSDSIPIDVRVIAATNQNLQEMIKQGKFREDLYYRLNVIPLEMIPLRNRKDDIPLLLEYFLEKYNRILDKKILGYTSEVTEILISQQWIGNVRELENAIEYMVNISNKNYLIFDNLPNNIKDSLLIKKDETIRISKVDDVIKQLINDAVAIYGDTVKGKSMAAEALGISRATLYRKLKETN